MALQAAGGAPLDSRLSFTYILLVALQSIKVCGLIGPTPADPPNGSSKGLFEIGHPAQKLKCFQEGWMADLREASSRIIGMSGRMRMHPEE